MLIWRTESRSNSWNAMRWARTSATNSAISPATTARPVQAALASAGSFAIGAALPLLLMIGAPVQTLVGSLHRVPAVSGTARGGRGKSGRRTDTQGDHPRYVLGALAMAATAGIGVAFGKRI
jgi:hypothetical protein